MSYADVAEALSCSTSTIKRLWHKGTLPAPVEVDGLGPRFLEDEIAAYIARARISARSKPGKKAT